MFPRVVCEIEQLSDPLAVIDAEFMSLRTVHGGIGSAPSGKVRIKGVKVFGANEVTVLACVRLACEDWKKTLTLKIIR